MWKKGPSTVSIRPSVRTEVFKQALKHAGYLFVPLVPVVTTGNDVELVTKMLLLQQRSEIAVRGQ